MIAIKDISKIGQYLESRYPREVTVQEVSRQVGMSEGKVRKILNELDLYKIYNRGSYEYSLKYDPKR